jgi:hypothetical protein
MGDGFDEWAGWKLHRMRDDFDDNDDAFIDTAKDTKNR